MKHNQHNSLPNGHQPVEEPVLDMLPADEQRLGSGEYAPRLLEGEQLLDVYRPPITERASLPSAETALLRITNAPNLDRVGEFGPSVGSRAMPENDGVEELKRFEVLFGRDSLIVANFLADQYPELLRTTVVELSKHLGRGYNPKSEQEPGRVPHELRDPNDPIALRITAEHGVEWPLYTTVDATPLYISAVAGIAKRTKGAFLSEQYVDVGGEQHTMRYALDQSVAWLERRLGNNPEGLLECKATTELINQSWKDSWDSYMHADGALANAKDGVASVEVQALAYDALLDAAGVYRMTDNPADKERAVNLEANAARLKEEVMRTFWVEDDKGGYFALGTDRDKDGNLRPMKVRTSNMGHVLDSHLFDTPDAETSRRKEALTQTLFEPDMLNAAGVRTLSSREHRFRPGSYHNGSVWLWDTYKIARGLSRQGYDALAAEGKHGRVGGGKHPRRYPEFVRGDSGPTVVANEYMVEVWDNNNQRANTLEQPPQEIQAWTVAAILAIKKKRQLADGANVDVRSVDAQPFERLILREVSRQTATHAAGALALGRN